MRVLLLFATLSVLSFFMVKNWWVYFAIVVPVIILQLVDFYKLHIKIQKEVMQFVESVHYRDFSRNFNVRQAPNELRPLREGFNEINSTFKLISREKETQYQYLQKILEIVDTGIISYDAHDGTIMWINDAFKRLTGIPYLKTIHSLEKRDAILYQQISALKTGENKIVKLTKDKNTIKALVTATAFQTAGQVYKLIAFQNVDEALDETESQAWQKLLSVMTHEIMNSVAPISSLAETLKKRLNNEKENDDLELGIETIKRRSDGLLKFAESYRNLNKIARPHLTKVFARDLFETLHQLMQPTLEKKNIELDIILRDPSLPLEIDVNLIEQVLINLLLNAIEAVKDKAQPKIMLSADYAANNSRPYIKVSDNGSGISPEVADKIFIPFFSTKKNGSGIGLSLCKQIMLMHKGNIQLQTEENEGTSFKLQF